MFVFSTGNGVHGFTRDPSIGESLLSHPNIQITTREKFSVLMKEIGPTGMKIHSGMSIIFTARIP